MSDQLQKIRERIDLLDSEVLQLISQRAGLAQEVARIKAEAGDEPTDYYRPAREAEVLRAIQAANTGPLEDQVVARLFREIMSACLALESPLSVAYLGPAGSYTEAAAYKHFGHFIGTTPLLGIDEVFREVEAGSAAYGVVPIENSSEGVVSHTLDMFVASNLKICGEVRLPVHHYLLSQSENLNDIEVIYAHSQALGQCREWLDANLPKAQRQPVPSNAEGARMAAEKAGTAAVAGQEAGEIYGLKALAANIEDHPDNTTRFLVIGHQSVPATGKDMTSVLLSAQNKPGALHALLAPFAEHDVSMSRIESRPSKRVAWDYNFFIDVQGHAEDAKVAAALKAAEAEATVFRVLGSYPQAVL